MATNYDINYNDSRFTDVTAEEKAALNEVDVTYGDMISQSDEYFDKQIDAAQDYADKQTALQNQMTEQNIKKINQQKDQAEKDYIKEQSGAYVDWQKQSDQYGANAEKMASAGLAGSGYSESSQVSMYNTYQNRVAVAREAYGRAVLDYDNAIADAKLQNSSLLAEIAYNTLQKKLELSLQGFQYKNKLLLDKADRQMEVKKFYADEWQRVLTQINTENALAEEVRYHNATLAEQQRQHKEEMAYKNAALAEEKRQFNVLHSSAGGTGGGNPVISKTPNRGKTPNRSNTSPIVENKVTNPGSSNIEPTITNRHGKDWIEIPGHGRFSFAEVYAHVKDGTIKETIVNGKATYKWVGKKATAKNVTPDAKGYAAKQRELFK